MNADQFVSKPDPDDPTSNESSAEMASDNSTPPRPVQAPRRTAWPLALVLLALILMIGGPIAYVVISWSNRVAAAPERMVQTLTNAAAEAARPRITINEIVLNAVSDVQKKNKLVVFDTVVNADVTREEGASSWGVYWGTNVARVSVRDARVQYVIDLESVGTSDFQYDVGEKLLTVRVPRPRIDTSMVAIDPGRIQTLDLRGGWARFDKYETRDNAIASLRPQVISQAQVPFVQRLAQDAGLQTMTRFLEPLASTLAQDGARVQVEYVQ